MNGGFVVAEGEIPEPPEYCELRVSSGLSRMTRDAAEHGLPRSLFAVTVRNADLELIGMGRVVGDGLHVQVVDIAVRPDWQKRGISRAVMESIMRYVDTSIPACAVVSLLADVDWLYQKFGFRESTKSEAMVYRRST